MDVIDPGKGLWAFRTQTRGEANVAVEQVAGITVQRLMSDYQISRIDVLKMDIEGAEGTVLLSSSSWIDHVQLLAIELHDRFAPGCTAAFEDAIRGRFPVRWQNGESQYAAREGVVDRNVAPKCAPNVHDQVVDNGPGPADQETLDSITSVAVIGCYDSGATLTAGVLDALGVVIGAQFKIALESAIPPLSPSGRVTQGDCECAGDERAGSVVLSAACFFGKDLYEPSWLSGEFRRWWNEPEIREMVPQVDRIAILRRWRNDMVDNAHAVIALKHPLLALCAEDLLAAWGENTKFIWTDCFTEEPDTSIQMPNWTTSQFASLKRKLRRAASEFFERQAHLRIDYSAILANPDEHVDKIIDFIGAPVSTSARKQAIQFMQQFAGPNRWPNSFRIHE